MMMMMIAELFDCWLLSGELIIGGGGGGGGVKVVDG